MEKTTKFILKKYECEVLWKLAVKSWKYWNLKYANFTVFWTRNPFWKDNHAIPRKFVYSFGLSPYAVRRKPPCYPEWMCYLVTNPKSINGHISKTGAGDICIMQIYKATDSYSTERLHYSRYRQKSRRLFSNTVPCEWTSNIPNFQAFFAVLWLRSARKSPKVYSPNNGGLLGIVI